MRSSSYSSTPGRPRRFLATMETFQADAVVGFVPSQIRLCNGTHDVRPFDNCCAATRRAQTSLVTPLLPCPFRRQVKSRSDQVARVCWGDAGTPAKRQTACATVSTSLSRCPTSATPSHVLDYNAPKNMLFAEVAHDQQVDWRRPRRNACVLRSMASLPHQGTDPVNAGAGQTMAGRARMSASSPRVSIARASLWLRQVVRPRATAVEECIR